MAAHQIGESKVRHARDHDRCAVRRAVARRKRSDANRAGARCNLDGCGNSRRRPHHRTQRNRKPAGTFANGVLTIALEARAGTWYPGGTEGRATVRNSLTKPMWLYGMGAKAGLKDSVRIAAGATLTWRYTINGVPPTVFKPVENIARVR